MPPSRHRYFCGIYRSSLGNLAPFSVREKAGDFHEAMERYRKFMAADGNILLEEHLVLKTPEEMKLFLEEILNKQLNLKNAAKDIHSGSVIDYVDGDGVHTAVVLHVGIDRSFLLFATTNPQWNPRARPITSEECALLGYPERENRTTYFAPVIRDNAPMLATGKEFPQHRVEQLMDEFGCRGGRFHEPRGSTSEGTEAVG